MSRGRVLQMPIPESSEPARTPPLPLRVMKAVLGAVLLSGLLALYVACFQWLWNVTVGSFSTTLHLPYHGAWCLLVLVYMLLMPVLVLTRRWKR